MKKIDKGDMPAGGAGASHGRTSTTSLTNGNEILCEVCYHSGWISYDVPITDPRFGQLFPCPACAPRRAAQRQQATVSAARSELDRELGKRLRRCSFENFELERPLKSASFAEKLYAVDAQRAMLRKALDTCRTYADAPAGWLFLFGTYGSGKSHLAAAIANTVTGRGVQVTYTTAARLWDWLRVGYRSGEFESRLGSIQAVPLLVLDDVGAEKLTDWVDETLFKLVNARYLDDLPTVLTSNEAASKLPGRVASRIREVSQQVFLAVSDYRELRTG
jgi:DNA replication protein DnaC